MAHKNRSDFGDDFRGGSFADVTASLPSLFSDPDGRGTQSWREMFGYVRRPPKNPNGLLLSVSEEPKSSSGS